MVVLSDITIGQFFPGNSVLHRLDPRVKLVLVFSYILAVFIPDNWLGLALAVVLLVVSVGLSHIPPKVLLKGLKPVVPLLLFTSLINIFYVQGRILVEFWIFKITAEGIYTAIFIAIRIFCLIAAGSLLTYTTSPTSLTDGLERVMNPLKVLRVPVHEIAMMMTIALRFIPTLIEETQKIMNAQKARGADLENGKLIASIKALIPILIPLLISSVRRAYELAEAMECRCYNGGEGRQRMKQLKYNFNDIISFTVVLLVCVGVIIFNILF